MGVLREEEAQGATEYLLMLAGVMVVVAIAVYYVISLGGKAKGLAENQEENIENALD